MTTHTSTVRKLPDPAFIFALLVLMVAVVIGGTALLADNQSPAASVLVGAVAGLLVSVPATALVLSLLLDDEADPEEGIDLGVKLTLDELRRPIVQSTIVDMLREDPRLTVTVTCNESQLSEARAILQRLQREAATTSSAEEQREALGDLEIEFPEIRPELEAMAEGDQHERA